MGRAVASYVLRFPVLRKWAFGHEVVEGNIFRYPERCQAKRSQMNDTWGRCVPIDVVRRTVGFRLLAPRAIQARWRTLPTPQLTVQPGFEL